MASPFDSKYSQIVERIRFYARQYGINENVAIWQIWQESRFNPRAVSPAGAKGLCQFMPGTAARFGVNVWDIESSLNGWGKYMSWLLKQPYINGNIAFALAGYNAGEGKVKKFAGIPPYKETENYVRIILENAQISPNYENSDGSMSAIGAGGVMIAAILLFLILD